MSSYKFRIGESVMLKPSISRNVPGGVYEVTKQTPAQRPTMVKRKLSRFSSRR
jgi:hypothetical protein